MDEDTLRERAEAWRRRAAETCDPRDRAANLLIAEHYAALAQLMAARPGDARSRLSLPRRDALSIDRRETRRGLTRRGRFYIIQSS